VGSAGLATASIAMTKQSSLKTVLARRMTIAALAAFATMAAATAIYVGGTFLIGYDDDGFTPIDAFFTFGGFGLSLIASAAIGSAMARRLIAPLQDLGNAAEAIARGNFRVRVGTNSRELGELTELVNNFNTMATLLERAQIDLAYQNSAVAHELRTPLTILKGRLLGLVDGVFEPTPELYGGLVRHVDDLIRIVDDLRALALFSAGRLELKLERFELKAEITALVAALDTELAHAGMHVVLDVEALSIRADRVRVRQILVALIGNACRYAQGSRLTIATRQVRDMVGIRVADTGPGLAEDELELIFEPFWRADESRSRAHGGSGLGLAVVRAVTEAHEGTVRASRGSEGGLTFDILLPISPA
jgi:two-component system sensor histidine kinase AdeS